MPPINTNSSDKCLRQMEATKEKTRGRESLAAYLAIPRQINLQCFGIVLEAKRSHSKEDVLAVDRLALFLLALFGRCTQRQRLARRASI